MLYFGARCQSDAGRDQKTTYVVRILKGGAIRSVGANIHKATKTMQFVLKIEPYTKGMKYFSTVFFLDCFQVQKRETALEWTGKLEDHGATESDLG